MLRRKKLKQDPATLIQSFSKNLLGLKFMQRAKKVAEKEVSDYSDDDDDDDVNSSVKLDTSKIQKLKTKPKCIMNPSYQSCGGLRFGRLSFKGMNLDIETIMYNNSATHNRRDNDSSFDSAKAGSGEKRPADLDWDDEEDDEYE